MLDSSPYDKTMQDRIPFGLGGPCYGVYPAIVKSLEDPEGLARISIELPWARDPGGACYTAWARIATMMGGKDRGSFFFPDEDDEVLVAFQNGDPRYPYVIGGLWNGVDSPPESLDSKNVKKVIKSRNGVTITLDDSDGQETLKLETPGGQSLILQDGPGSIEIADSNGNSIKMESSGITITAAAKLTITASAKAEISASMVNVQAGMADFSGVVKSPTVKADSVLGSTYLPGAGNIL